MTFSPTIGEWFISSTIFGAAARKGQVIMVKEAVLKQYGKSIAECTDMLQLGHEGCSLFFTQGLEQRG